MNNPDLGSATVKQINDYVGCQTRANPLEVFHGYEIWFDGYVSSADSTRIVGRWLSAKEGEQRSGFVSVCGGTPQWVEYGQPFDISGVWTTLMDATENGIEYFKTLKDKALVDLKAAIVERSL